MHDYLNKPNDGQYINSILDGVCRYYDADRAYIIEIGKERTTADNTREGEPTVINFDMYPTL